MQNPIDLLKSYIDLHSRAQIRRWLNSQEAELCGRANTPYQFDIPPDVSKESRTLAHYMAAALILSGLRSGDAVTVDGHYYELIAERNILKSPEDRAMGADIMYDGYLLSQATNVPGNQPQQFIDDYPKLMGAFSMVAAHRIVADRYPTALYLKYMGKVVSAAENEVTTAMTRVAIPVIVISAAAAVGIALSVTWGWAVTGVLAIAGGVGLLNTIKSSITSIRRARSYSMQVDGSLGPDRAKSVAWLMDESSRLAEAPNLEASKTRLRSFVRQTESNLRFLHESTPLSNREVMERVAKDSSQLAVA